jgi:hypothetical protein
VTKPLFAEKEMAKRIVLQPSEKMEKAIQGLCATLGANTGQVVRLALSILLVHVEAHVKSDEIIIKSKDHNVEDKRFVLPSADSLKDW